MVGALHAAASRMQPTDLIPKLNEAHGYIYLEIEEASTM